MSTDRLTPAEVRLAQYGERTSTWSTATYNDGAEKALHEIALGLKVEIDRLRAELARQERLHGDTIDDRDRAQDAADKLAYAVAAEDVIGEHTADNSPWANALDLITPQAEVDKLRAEIAVVRSQTIDWAAGVVDDKLSVEPDHGRASALYEVLLDLRGELPCTCARSSGLHERECRKYVPGHELISPVLAMRAYRTERPAATPAP
ncbi:hypothetical protein [Streptomyces azureus]|uniref:Uncharacterized protein n=1 Tax=Streptomyces azureus TaxID=146537 RepID=A0A0K8PGT1_STRAJ|nr:hypothetical protein [Streptomyces azureus]GAP46918.1 uncharacterized protein SAZU_1655 [Streptomyces azureus]